jgi:hypothetical protein
MEHKFGRIYEPDSRNVLYQIAPFLSGEIVSKTWDLNVWLDQGSEGACVGFGFAHELNADPSKVMCSAFCAFDIYYAAQRIDPWPGGSYPGATPFYEGTSVLAGAKIVRDWGHYSEFRWAFTENEVARAVSQLGPVVIGVNWYQGMLDTDANGYIAPTGSVQGGHCVVVIGIDVEEDCYIIHNSWGQGWGENGRAKIKRSDMALLLDDDGEALIPVRTVVTDPVNPEPVRCGFFCKIWRTIKALFGF